MLISADNLFFFLVKCWWDSKWIGIGYVRYLLIKMSKVEGCPVITNEKKVFFLSIVEIRHIYFLLDANRLL